MNKTVLFLALLCLSLITTSSVRAVIIRGGDGTGNTSVPVDDPGWNNVGKRSGGSAVYLMDRWVLTAAHVGAGSVTFGSTSYNALSGSAHRLTEPGGSGVVDLTLFQLDSTPAGMTNLALTSQTPAVGTEVTGIGYGRNRAANETRWYVDGDTGSDPWIWKEEEFSGWDYFADGYKYATGSSKRWGKNHMEGSMIVDAGYGDTSSLFTDFDASEGAGDDEFQGATYDSGGGVFAKNGSEWELSGIFVTIGTYSGQPSGTAVYGNRTYAADISVYRDQIMAIIPEPNTFLLFVLAASVSILCRRKIGARS